jgi:hypothetical protein
MVDVERMKVGYVVKVSFRLIEEVEWSFRVIPNWRCGIERIE